jgi:DNA-binding transcriptional LysR family regulator
MAAAKRKKSLRRTIRLPQLELLAAMDDAPTLSAAARAARVPQPAASRLLRALAQDLEIELFERAGRSLRPTAAGRALQRRAAGLVAELNAYKASSTPSIAASSAPPRSASESRPATCWCRGRSASCSTWHRGSP